jgi:hypothetical protein
MTPIRRVDVSCLILAGRLTATVNRRIATNIERSIHLKHGPAGTIDGTIDDQLVAFQPNRPYGDSYQFAVGRGRIAEAARQCEADEKRCRRKEALDQFQVSGFPLKGPVPWTRIAIGSLACRWQALIRGRSHPIRFANVAGSWVRCADVMLRVAGGR